MIALDDAASIRKALTDPTGPKVSDVQHAADLWDSNQIPAGTKGIAGLFLLCATAEPLIRKQLPDLPSPNHYLKPPVQQTLFAECAVHQDVLAKITNLQYHSPGTTSIILRSGRHALKIIKPWFWDVTSISDATAAYYDNFGDLGSHCPEVIKSHAKWIFMAFLEGKTLTQYMIEDLRPLRASPEKLPLFLSEIDDIVDSLCDALIACSKHKPPIHHLDLSPDNIIVDGKPGRSKTVNLIDFGANSLLLTHLGNGDNVARASAFVPPELREGADGDSLSDVYSLGMILLEMLAHAPLSGPEAAGPLDEVWVAFPHIAADAEDMIANNPNHRLLQIENATSDPFPQLSKSVSHAVKIHKKTKLVETSFINILFEIFNSNFTWRPVTEAHDNYRDCIQDCDKPPLLWVLKWRFAAQILHFIVMFLIVLTGWKFVNTRFCHWCVAGPPLPFWDGAFGIINGFTPGRLMALTFALIFSRYYSEIFGLITLSYLEKTDLRQKARVAERAMRSLPILGFFPLIYGLLFDPKAWAFCASFGLFVVFAVNRTTYKFFQLARGEVAEKFERLKVPSSPYIDDALSEFGRWYKGIFIYSVSLLVVGICIAKGLAKDEWLYAVFAGVFVNLGVIYRIHCWQKPPQLRTAFARIVFSVRRLDKAVMKSDGVKRRAGEVAVAHVGA
jgi:serine/threonine protein kinase